MLLFFGAAALAAACGNGTDVSATFSMPSGGAISGAGGAGAGPASDASSSASSSSSQASSSSASSGSSSASSSSSSGAGGGGGCDHSAPDTCDTAQEITSIAGDDGNDTRTLTGTTSAWFKVFVNDVSNFASNESYTATLVSPPGMVFRLFAYTGDGMMTNCLGAAVQGTGMPPSVTDSWPDSFGPDDSKWISLEVRYESGQVCNPMPKWTLTVQGNTKP